MKEADQKKKKKSVNRNREVYLVNYFTDKKTTSKFRAIKEMVEDHPCIGGKARFDLRPDYVYSLLEELLSIYCMIKSGQPESSH